MGYQAGFALRYINVLFTPSFGQCIMVLVHYEASKNKMLCPKQSLISTQFFYRLVHL